jgi:hypothetical protein
MGENFVDHQSISIPQNYWRGQKVCNVLRYKLSAHTANLEDRGFPAMIVCRDDCATAGHADGSFGALSHRE